MLVAIWFETRATKLFLILRGRGGCSPPAPCDRGVGLGAVLPPTPSPSRRGGGPRRRQAPPPPPTRMNEKTIDKQNANRVKVSDSTQVSTNHNVMMLVTSR
jgi:hypothetical protein